MPKKDFIKITIQDIEIAEEFFENDKHLNDFLINVIRYYRGKNTQIKTKIVEKYFKTYKKTMDYLIASKLDGKLGASIKSESKSLKGLSLEGSLEGSLEETPSTKKKEETIKKKEEREKENFDWFLKHLNECVDKKYRSVKIDKLKVRLKTYSVEEIKRAILNASKSEYHVGEGFRYLTPNFFVRGDEKIDQWLNAPEPKNNNYSKPQTLKERLNNHATK